MKVLAVALCVTAEIAIASVEFSTANERARYRELLSELRCLVCQNQSLADSNAELARDLREEVYRLVKQGKNNEEVKRFLVDRYGDFVLYRPPVKPTTYVLWGGPVVIAIALLWLLLRWIYRRSRGAAQVDLDVDEQNRLHGLVDRQGEPDP